MFDAKPDTPRQIATVGVVAHLVACAKDVEGILALQYFLDEVRNNVGHGQPNIATHNLAITQRSLFADSHAVKRTRDRVRQPILLMGALDKEFCCQFLKSIG